MKEAVEAKQDRIKWILNDSVVVVDKWCYALTPGLRTVCIGKEADVLKEKRK